MARNSFIDQSMLQAVIGSLKDRNPNLAKQLLSLYQILDMVAMEFSLVFEHDGQNLEMAVRGIEPVAKSKGNGNILGANIYLGMTSDFIEGYINAGQILMLLARGGGIDYDAFIYKSVDSIILNDSDLEKLAKMLRIAKHQIQRSVAMTLNQPSQQKKRVVKRNENQNDPQPQNPTPRQPSIPQHRPQSPTPTPNQAQTNGLQEIPNVNNTQTPSRQQKPNQPTNNGQRKQESPQPKPKAKKEKKGSGNMGGLIDDNVPPFPLKTKRKNVKVNRETVNVPADLRKFTKK